MFSVRSVIAAIVFSAAATGVAFARDAVFTVKLSAPVAEQTRVIAQNTLWNCVGDTCVARPSHGASVHSCRQFVRESGIRVTAYGAEGRQLSADEISRCNGESPESLQARN